LSDVWIMLGRNHHRIQGNRGIAVIGKSNLSLAIWSQVRNDTVLSDLSKAASQTVGDGDWQRHVLFGLVGSVTEHQTLVACTSDIVLIKIAAITRLSRGSDAVTNLL